MPIFEYKCKDCGDDFELLVNSGTKIECRSCGSKEVSKKLSLFGYSMKESGGAPECATSCGGGFAGGACGSGMCGHGGN